MAHLPGRPIGTWCASPFVVAMLCGVVSYMPDELHDDFGAAGCGTVRPAARNIQLRH